VKYRRVRSSGQATHAMRVLRALQRHY
jgi:hypothetical protein